MVVNLLAPAASSALGSGPRGLPGGARPPCYRVVAVLLVLSAVALALNHFGDLNPVFLDPVARTLLGLAAGVGIGIVAPSEKMPRS